MKLEKIIGRKSLPLSQATFPNKKAASIVCDTIKFHGAKLTVDVHNMYRGRLFRDLEMNVAAERSVTLEEDSIECSVDSNFATIRLRKHKMGEEPSYGAFIWELPKSALKKFPLFIQYRKDGELVEVGLLRDDRQSKKARRSKTNV